MKLFCWNIWPGFFPTMEMILTNWREHSSNNNPHGADKTMRLIPHINKKNLKKFRENDEQLVRAPHYNRERIAFTRFSTFTLMGATMKCPKCNYTSFDYLTECKKCGQLLDEVKKRLNLQLSKPTINIEETVNQEAENMVEDSVIDEQKNDPFADQETSLVDIGELDGDELIALNSITDSLPPLEGLGSMENLQDDDLNSNKTGGIEFINVQAEEEGQKFITGFNPSDEQLEELQIQEDLEIEGEMPELDIEISRDVGDNLEDYDHEKVIELTAEDQIFDLELDLEDKETNS